MPRNTPIKKTRVPDLDDGDRVGVSFGVTLNMGDFQSLRVEAWAETTKREGESVEDTYRRIFVICEREANEKAEEYEKR